MIERLPGITRNVDRTANLIEFGLVQVDVSGIIRACNLPALSILGRRGEELIGTEAATLWGTAIDFQGSPVTVGEGESQTVGVRRGDGETIWLEIQTQSLYGAEGAGKVNTIYSFRPLNREEGHLLQQLQREKAQLETVLEQMPAALMIVEAKSGRLLLVNEQVEAILNRRYPRYSVPDDDLFSFTVSGADGSPIDRRDWPLTRSLLRGETVKHERQHLTRDDGARIVLDISSAPILDAGGEIIAAVVIFQDVTEAKRREEERERAEIALRHSEAKFKRIFDSEMIPMGIWRKAGGIVEANAALLDLLGYTRPELERGEIDWIAMTPPEYREVDRKALNELDTRGYSDPFEKVYLHKDGRPIPILAGAAAFTDDKDSGVFFAIDLTARQQAQDALKQSENKFSRLVEANFFGVAIGDYSGKILYANDALLNMIGYGREELEAGVYWVKLTPPEYLPLDHAAGEELRERGVSTPFEKEYIHKDGHRVPILIGSALLDHPGGGEDQIITFYMDLTQLKQAQVATLKQQILLETVLEQAADAVIVCDRQGRITLANSTARRLARNYSRETADLNCLDWGVGLSPEGDLIPLHRYVLYKALGGRVSKALEARMIYPDGYYYDILLSAAPLKDEGGGLIGAVATFMDVTERKRSESIFRETAESLSVALSAAHMGYWRWDRKTDAVTLSERGLEIFAVDGDRPVTWGEIQSRIHRDDLRATREAVRRAIDKQEDYDIEYRLCLPDGGERWVSAKGRAQLDSFGKVIGMLGVAQDITERKRATGQLQQQARELNELNASLRQTTDLLMRRNQELDKFAYVVSHDLKAPLRAIANLSVWLEEDLQGKLSAEHEGLMNLLRSRVYRLEALIDGLLAYSRVGRLEVGTEVTDLDELVREIVDFLMPPSRFTIGLESSLPPFTTKKLLLSQVFSNLISNALKHHHKSEGRIKINARDGDGFYRFSVSDDGPGISPLYHEKVFTIFQTLEPRDKKENTGIGLSIVKKIVESEGGRVWIDSDEGRGTTFHFTWPKYDGNEKNTDPVRIGVF